jgi:hypothetical protein
MNNTGASVFNNKAVNAAVNSINTVSANVLNSGGVGSNSIWYLIGAVVILVVSVYGLYRYDIIALPGVISPSGVLTPTGEPTLPSSDMPSKKPAADGGFGENWCFVGEDLTGRWCVKVPNASACSPERLFSSRPGCELVEASASPAGINKNGGATMTPLFAVHTK